MSDTRAQADVAAAADQGGHLARNVLYLFLGQVASTALSIALNAVLGRHLSAPDFGVYYLVTSMTLFAYVFVEWGQGAYLIREVAQRPREEGYLLGSALVFRLLVAVFVTFATAALAWAMGYQDSVARLAGLAAVCNLPLALSQPFGYLFRGRNRMDLDAAVTVTLKALLVGLAIPALLLGGQVGAVLLSQGLAGLGALAVAVLLARRVGLARPAPTRAGLAEMGRDGTPLAVFFVAIAAQPYLDAVVLSKLVPGEVVGWYGAARTIMGVLVAPATILGAASFPELARCANDLPGLRAAMRRALRPLLALGALGAIGTYLFAGFVIATLYGPGRYDPAVGVLQLFAPSMFLLFIDFLLGTTITAIGRSRDVAIYKVANVALSTGLALLLVPWFQRAHGNGGEGLVVAFGIAEFVMVAAYLRLLPRGALQAGTLGDVGRALAAGLGTLAVFLLLPPLSPWVGMPLCVGLFVALTVATGLFRLEELGRLRSALRRTR